MGRKPIIDDIDFNFSSIRTKMIKKFPNRSFTTIWEISGDPGGFRTGGD